MSKVNNILNRVSTIAKSQSSAPVVVKKNGRQKTGRLKHFLVAVGTEAAAARLTIDPLRQAHYLIQFSETPVRMVKKKRGQIAEAYSSEKRFQSSPSLSPEMEEKMRERDAYIAKQEAEAQADAQEAKEAEMLLGLHAMFNDFRLDMGGNDENGLEYTSDMTNMHKVYGNPNFGKKYKAVA